MISREELYRVIADVPENKLDDLFVYAKKLSEQDSEFEKAFDLTIDKYNDAFKNLVER